jgi:hypothetical protein
MYPHNQGTVRDFQSHGSKSVGARSSSFQCHLQQTAEVVREETKTFQSHLKRIEENLCQSHLQEDKEKVPLPLERNLIEL